MRTLLYTLLMLSMISCKERAFNEEAKQYLVHQNYDLRIAFGSCSNQDKPQILWDEINHENPDAWIWLGDNIYGDTKDMSKMRAKYNKQKSHEGYQKLRSNAIIHGIWDDHDYGINDGGKHFSAKAESQIELLNFLDVPEQSPRRTRAGAYYSAEIKKSDISVKLICLDTRYFRDDPNEAGTGTILGEAQWEWLVNEMKTSKADVNIIASSIQAIPEQHRFEKWQNFPSERARLFDLINSSGINNPIIISGDRHIGEFSHINWNNNKIFEITSSSLTHGWSKRREEANKHRIGPIAYLENYGILELRIKDGKLQVNGRLMAEDSRILNEMKLFK